MSGERRFGAAVDLSALRRPAGCVAETLPYPNSSLSNVQAVASGTLQCTSVPLAAGMPVTTVKVSSGTTGATAAGTGAPTHQWLAILRVSDRAVMVKSADRPGVDWGPDALQLFTFASTWYAPTTDNYAVGLLVTAATVPSQRGNSSNNPIAAQTPNVMRADTGLTDPASLGSTAAAFTQSNAAFYAALFA